MAKKSKEKKQPEVVEEEWQEVEESSGTEWEWIEWEKGETIVGYWAGSIVAGKVGDQWRIGLLLKQDYEEAIEEDEPPIMAFSIPVKLQRKLEKIEKEHGLGVLVKIVCLGKEKFKTSAGKTVKAWAFKVLVNPKKKVDEEVVKQFGFDIVPLSEKINQEPTNNGDENDDFEE